MDAELWIALFTLSTLEIVLARKVGLAFACLTRIALLVTLAHFARMDDKHMPLFSLFGKVISVRDLILGGGGVFLIVKGIMEIVDAIRGKHTETVANTAAASFAWVIAQIAIIDIVFSIDSVITAVGMVRNIPVMVGAIVLAVAVMLFASNPVGEFIDNNPAIRMLALAFIVLIGIVLVGECLDVHIPRAYIYGSMAFSAIVEVLNLLAAKKQNPPA